MLMDTLFYCREMWWFIRYLFLIKESSAAGSLPPRRSVISYLKSDLSIASPGLAANPHFDIYFYVLISADVLFALLLFAFLICGVRTRHLFIRSAFGLVISLRPMTNGTWDDYCEGRARVYIYVLW